MSVNKAYTSETKMEAFLNVSIVSGAADDAINEAVALIDQITGRNFIADNTASARYFDGSSGNELDIDECTAISKVEWSMDEWGDFREEIAAGGSDGYYLLPNNAAARGIPIKIVKLRSRYWIEGVANHKITAKWGFSTAVPSGIELAATILASGIYMYNRGGGSGNVSSERIGNYSVTYADLQGWDALDRAKSILQSYRKFII
jgi:hypothetical protein